MTGGNRKEAVATGDLIDKQHQADIKVLLSLISSEMTSLKRLTLSIYSRVCVVHVMIRQ